MKKNIKNVENIIPDVSILFTITGLNTEIREVEIKIVDVNGLVTATVLDTKIENVENRIPDTSKFIDTLGFNELTEINFNTKMKET